MKKLHNALAILFLLFALTFPVFAQDTDTVPTAETTVEVTVEPLPVVEPAPEETSDLVQQFDFSQLLNLVLIGIILIQSAWINGSIPANKWLEFVKVGTDVAAKTEGGLDDKAFALAKQITPYLQKLGVLTDTGVLAQSVPVTTTSISPDTTIQTVTTTTIDNVETKG